MEVVTRMHINALEENNMEFLESNNLNHWQLYTPLLGYLIIYVGIKLRVRRVDEDDT